MEDDDADTDVGDLDEPEGDTEVSVDVMKSHDFRSTKHRKKATSDSVNHDGSGKCDTHQLKLSGKSNKSRKTRMASTPISSTSQCSQPFRLTSQQPQQPRNYRVVHTTADGSSQKSLKLTLRAASPKEETKVPADVSIPGADVELPRMVTPHSYQHFVAQHNNMNNISTPLNIDTGDESSSASSSSSSSSQSSSFYEHYIHPKRTKRIGFPTRDRWSIAAEKLAKHRSRGSVDEAKSLRFSNITTTINNNISTNSGTNSSIFPGSSSIVTSSVHAKSNSSTAIDESKCEKSYDSKEKPRVAAQVKKPNRTTPNLPQRKGRSAMASSIKVPTTPRRTNGKRSLTNGPMLNGYGVPASIESMSSLKEYINYDNFVGLPREMQRELMTLLPSTDCLSDESGNFGINPSALKNEYFSKSLDEYLNKGYRAAAMKSQRYPLSTGHNTRQRRRNEDTGVDLSPKDEWKKAYFETYWGEKLSLGSSFEKSSTETSADSTNCPAVLELNTSLQLKQPVVKLTRTDSLSEQCEEPLLKVVPKEGEMLSDTDSPEIQVPVIMDPSINVAQTPNSRSSCSQSAVSVTSRSRNAKLQRLRKREQRTLDDNALPSTQNEENLTGARKRRRRQSLLENSPIHLPRETQLCSLSVTASALSLVDEQGKPNSTKSGSSSGPSNNSSSSPSTYGETSPQNEELGGHPSEFIKPRPPPPPTSVVAAVAAAAAANVSLTSTAREKAFSGSGHHLHSPASQCRLSRLNGKTVGELRRDISYRLMTVSQRVNTAGNPIVSTNASLSPLPPPTSGTAVVSLTPAFIKGIPSSTSLHHPVLNVQWPRCRKYALAARTFERQLQQRKKEKEDENCGLNRLKRSHMIRLKRLQECNARRAVEQQNSDHSIKTEDSVPPSSCPSSTSQADSCHLSSSDWTPGNSKNTTCASSSASTSTMTSGSSTSTTLKPSTGVVRTRDGASIVFRDKLCPATLANVCNRLPDADVRLSFGLPEDLLPRLHEEMTDVCSTAYSEPGPRLQLQWKVNPDTRVVHLSFFEAPVEVKTEVIKKEEPRDSSESSVQPSNSSPSSTLACQPPESSFPSLTSDCAVETTVPEALDSSVSQLLTCPAASWSSPSSHQPSSSPTSTVNISAAHESETLLSPTVDDFLSDSQDKKCFRMKRRVLLE